MNTCVVVHMGHVVQLCIIDSLPAMYIAGHIQARSAIYEGILN